jgi:hypothetical protein
MELRNFEDEGTGGCMRSNRHVHVLCVMNFVVLIAVIIQREQMSTSKRVYGCHLDYQVRFKRLGFSFPGSSACTPCFVQHLRQLVRNAQKELAGVQALPPIASASEDKVDGNSGSVTQMKPKTKAQEALKRYLQDVALRIGVAGL